MTMCQGVLLEEEGGEGGKWVGWNAKALVGFGLWFGGDGQPPQNRINVMPMDVDVCLMFVSKLI